MKKMKAQASLEMVVGLIILLVVAAVVISLVLYFINPRQMPDPTEQLSIEDFINKCTTYCEDIDSLEFCRYYYPGNDWDKDGLKYEKITLGKYQWPACEDKVYCFLAVVCEDRYGVGINVIQKCRDVLCQTYTDKYGGDVGKATNELRDDINFSPNCNFNAIPDDENWYKQVFEAGCV